MPAVPAPLPAPSSPPSLGFDPVTVAAVSQHHASLQAAARTVAAINAATVGEDEAPQPRSLMRATAAAGSAIAATAVSLAAIDGSVRERSTLFTTAGAAPEPPARAHHGSTLDDQLLDLLRGRHVESLADVLALMDRLAVLLPEGDGLACFNQLYRMVTQGVGQSEGVRWEDQAWIERLDVIFAGLYFDGIEACLAGSPRAPLAWRALMDRRHDRSIAAIQFALAGMSAHINRDLAAAVAFTWEQRGTIDHGRGTAQFRDFKRVDHVLDATEPRAMQLLATGLFAVMSQLLGELDDWAALSIIHGARDLAWSHAQLLADLGAGSEAAALYLGTLDTAAAGCAVAAMVPTH
jgi:hypothetical protein